MQIRNMVAHAGKAGASSDELVEIYVELSDISDAIKSGKLTAAEPS
jgi:hypothetical protein